MFVEGVEALSLNHGITGDIKARHEYFGSNKIVQDLRVIDPIGFADGHIQFSSDCMVRCPITKLLCGFDVKKLISSTHTQTSFC